MSYKRNGLLTPPADRCKHYRPWLKRYFWKHERKAAKTLCNRALHDQVKVA